MKSVCFVLHADLFTPWPIMRAMKEIEVLIEHGYYIFVVSWIKDSLDLPKTEEREGIKVHRFFLPPPKKSFLKRFLAYRRILKEMSKKVIEIKPNAIVAHDLEILKAGVIAKKALNVPLFFDAHENWPEMVAENSKLESRFFARLQKKLLKNVTYSYTYGDDLTDKYKGMGYPAVSLYNSKSLDSIPKIKETDIGEMKDKFGLKKDDFVIGFSGSVNLENGTQQVIDAMKNLPKNYKFLVVGGSGRAEDLENVKKHVAKRRVQERVILTGRVKSEDLLRYSAVFDVGTALFQPLNPNQIARVPNKLFDYMSMSVPMIVSDFPNMRKVVVTESKCGFAVKPMDINAITKAILHFSKNPDDAKKMGKAGRIKFEKFYSWDVQKKKLKNSHPLWRGEA
ncbi:MAG: glycosyltransferase family 4 protein [Thermoplasmata archaeon]|nr:MAG: glycosyltransferase family 4 protein [Thermoplasmata archaeon]